MFSGFSNQVNSWMGAVKGEPHDEEVPTPTAQQAADTAAAAEQADSAGASATNPSQQQQQQLDEVPIDGSAAAGSGDGANVQRLVWPHFPMLNNKSMKFKSIYNAVKISA